MNVRLGTGLVLHHNADDAGKKAKSIVHTVVDLHLSEPESMY
ncbi:hypothetical protein ACFO5U_15165 [Planococcus dechangensis]|uniref:Uncharacterized protein n=1 Tax=Planococcus dechangensis TaxID=1176255 RepID=A0ABV9MH76_9BACL